MRLIAALLVLGTFTKWNPPRSSNQGPKQLRFLAKHDLNVSSADDLFTLDKCNPLELPIKEQCKHVKTFCARSETLARITYPDAYFCAAPAGRPLAFAGLLIWLAFLFSFIGIAASDFFVPNLETMADAFGLDDNIAGVTFLAFGNGSPDLFSTLAAMRAGSGSLAIGELIGAASFIVSVVAGSMCIVKSFHVNPVPFLRDVGFFLVAMVLLFAILWDGLIRAWEAALLAGVYVGYVVVVVASTWWDNRREKKQRFLEEARSAFEREPVPSIAIYHDEEPYRDEPGDSHVENSLGVPDNVRQRAHSMPSGTQTNASDSAPEPPAPEYISRPHLPHSPSTSYIPHAHDHHLSPSRRPAHHRLSFLGALEFRDIVNSLHSESSTAVLSAFDPPPHPTRLYRRRSSRRSLYDSINSPGNDVELERPRSAGPQLRRSRDLLVPELPQHSDHQSGVPTLAAPTPPRGRRYIESRHLHPVPSPIPEAFSRTQTLDSVTAQQVPLPKPTSPSSHPQVLSESTAQSGLLRGLELFKTTAWLLFPTLADIRNKSAVRVAASILGAPAVFMLTLTLPVVSRIDCAECDEEEDTFHSSVPGVRGPGGEAVQSQPQENLIEVHNGASEGQLITVDSAPLEHFQSRGRTHSYASLLSYASHSSFDTQHQMEQLIDDAEDEVEQELRGATKFNKYLTAVQLILGPAFCVTVCFINMTRYLPWLLLAATVSGVSMSALVLVFSADGKHPVVRTALCLIGFIVAVVWIMAIADEVVQVLNTFGLIFGLSDAIIGLTIFAVGNSLGDFVANVTIANFAPIMGFSACFGGPMLNMLLGIGIGGTLVISRTGVPYAVEFDNTILVSCCGLVALLLSTLIFVPLNGFHLTRRWGIFLIFAYLFIMVANILVEIYL